MTRRSSRRSRTRSSPARTSSSSASAARRRRASPACSSDLLDEWLPVVRGGELNDDPFAPISAAAKAIVAGQGDETPIDWLPRDRRYAEKLATPDITIADLIGEVDPIRVAEGRYLSDELTLHFGLIPRANRGIFALNELPDLAERIQVGPAQRPRGARRPGPRLHDPAAAGPARRGVGQPGGLHVPRPDHHAAQGPPRLADPDPLPAHARARDRHRPPGEAGLPRAGRRPAGGRAAVHGGAGRRAHAPRPPVARRSASAAACRSACRSPTPRSSRPPRSSAPSGCGSRWPRRASPTWARSWRRRRARSRSRRWARTRPRSGSSSGW